MRKFGIMIALVHLAIVICPNLSSACSREDELRAAMIGAQSFLATLQECISDVTLRFGGEDAAETCIIVLQEAEFLQESVE